MAQLGSTAQRLLLRKPETHQPKGQRKHIAVSKSVKATELLASGTGKESNDFYTAKIQTAEFYFARLLPRADAHYSAALAPTSAVMQMPQELFQMA